MEIEQQDNQIKQISKGIIYGNISFRLGKKTSDPQLTHKWICYVRGYNNEDISYFVSQVTFTLHPSFQNPVRIISQPPFEIHEVGWGEFEINLRIQFVDKSFQDVEVTHLLKLHSNQSNSTITSKKPVISEFYDEIVFVNPSQQFIEILQQNDNKQVLIQEYNIKQEEMKSLDDDNSIEKNYLQYLQNIDLNQNTKTLEDAIYYVNHELKEYGNKIIQIEQQIQKLSQAQNINGS